MLPLNAQVEMHNGNYQLQKSKKHFTMAVLEAGPGRAGVRLRGGLDGQEKVSDRDAEIFAELKAIVCAPIVMFTLMAPSRPGPMRINGCPIACCSREALASAGRETWRMGLQPPHELRPARPGSKTSATE